MTQFRLPTWGGYLLILAWLALVLSVPLVRLEQVRPGLLMFAGAALAGTVLLLLFLFLMVLPAYRAARPGLRTRALLAMPLALLLATTLFNSRGIPAIHDITTDLGDPPAFVHAPSIRGAHSNSLDLDPDVLAQQEAAYPDLAPIQSSLGAQQALQRAAEVATDLGWEVSFMDGNTGQLEAVDTTFWMGFKDDIVVRVRPEGSGSRLDLRSVSRVGVSDMGTNARRIRDFVKRFGEKG